MKKLFISCPMKGRTEENIKKSMEKMHKIAEVVFEQELEVIPSYIEDHPPKDSHEAVWYLGESIKLLSQADYFIGVDSYEFTGCNIERDAARSYYIPFYLLPLKFAVTREELEESRRVETQTKCDCDCGQA